MSSWKTRLDLLSKCKHGLINTFRHPQYNPPGALHSIILRVLSQYSSRCSRRLHVRFPPSFFFFLSFSLSLFSLWYQCKRHTCDYFFVACTPKQQTSNSKLPPQSFLVNTMLHKIILFDPLKKSIWQWQLTPVDSALPQHNSKDGEVTVLLQSRLIFELLKGKWQTCPFNFTFHVNQPIITCNEETTDETDTVYSLPYFSSWSDIGVLSKSCHQHFDPVAPMSHYRSFPLLTTHHLQCINAGGGIPTFTSLY